MELPMSYNCPQKDEKEESFCFGERGESCGGAFGEWCERYEEYLTKRDR